MSTNMGSAEGYLDLDYSKFTTGLNLAIGQLKNFSDQANAMGARMEKIGEGIAGMGKTLTLGLTTPIVGLATAAVKSASAFEHQMADIRKELVATGDSTKVVNETMTEMGEDSKKWSAQFGQSTSDINAGLLTLKKDGYSGKEAIDDMKLSLYTARGANEDLEGVINTLGGSLEAYGMKTNNAAQNTANMTHIADSFAYIANHTKASVTSLGEGFSIVGQTASAMKQPIDVMTAALGELASQNIDVSTGANALKAGMVNLTKPTKEMSEAMKEIGLQAYDAQGNMKALPDIIDQINNGTKNMTNEQKQAAIATIFGKESLASWNALLDKGSDNLRNLANGAKNSAGEVQKLSDSMANTPQNVWKSLEETVKTLGINFGQDLLPSIVPVEKSLTNLINVFNKMPQAQQKMVIGAAGMVTAIGPALLITGELTKQTGELYTKIGEATKGFSEFGSKIGGSLSSIGGKFGGITESVKKLGSVFGITNTDMKLFGSLLQTSVGEKLSPITSKLNLFSSGFKSSMDKAFLALPTSMQKGIAGVSTGVSTIVTRFGQLGSLVAGPLAKFGSTVSSSLLSLMGVATKIFLPAAIVAGLIAGLGLANEQFGTQIQAMIKTATTEGPKIIDNFALGITAKIPELMKSGTTILIELVNAINANLPAIATGATNILTALVNGLANNLPRLIPAAISLIQTIALAIVNNLPQIIEAGLHLLVALAQGISNNSDKIVDTIVKVITTLVTVIGQHLPQIIEAGIKILVALISGLAKALPQLISYIPTIIRAIWNGFKNVDWASVGSAIINGIISGIEAMGSGIFNTLKAICGDAFEGIKSFLGIHSPSKVYHDEVGMQIGAGIATGITDSAPQLMQAVAGYVDVLSKSFSDQLNVAVDVINNKAIAISDALANAVNPERATRTTIFKDLAKGTETYETAVNKLQHANDLLGVSTGNNETDLRNMLGEMTNLSTLAVVASNQYTKLGNTIGWTADATQNALKTYQDAQKQYLELGQKAIDLQQSIRDNQYAEAVEALDVKIKSLTTDTGDNVQNLINEQQALELLKEKAAGLTTQYEELLQKYGEYDDRVKSAKKDVDDSTQAIQDMYNTIADSQQTLEDASASSLNDLFDKLKSSLKDYYDDMENQQEAIVQSQIDANDKWKENSLNALETVYNAKKDEISREKTLLDRSNSDQDDQDKIDADNQILSMNYSAKKKAEAQKDLDDILKEQNRRHQAEQLDDQADALDKQYDIDKDNIETIAKTNDEYYNNQLTSIKNFYTEKEKEANLDAEAQKLILSNNQTEMVILLKSYGQDYELAGNSLGERLVNGFKKQMFSLEEIFQAVSLQASDIMEKTKDAVSTSVSLSTVPDSSWNTAGNINTSNSSTVTTNQFGSLINVEHMDASNPQDINSLTQALQFVLDQKSIAKGGSPA